MLFKQQKSNSCQKPGNLIKVGLSMTYAKKNELKLPNDLHP
jgi:hypothetical protein